MADRVIGPSGIAAQERFVGKDIPTPEFDDDDGSAWPIVVTAMTQFAAGEADKYAVAGALSGSRLFVPIVAVLDEQETNEAGYEVEKNSHMATVTIERPDGKRGLLAFTGTDSMTDWRADCRPLAASARRVALAALAEDADVLILDIASGRRFVLERPGLLALAEGRAWLPPGEDGDIQDVVRRLLEGVPGAELFTFDLRAGADSTDLCVVAHPKNRDSAPSADAAVAVLTRAARAMQSDPVVAARLPNGIEFGVAH